MKVCILGWYGTETLGDRSILDGIVYILNKVYKKFEVSIGTLNTQFTYRTLIEDGNIYSSTAPLMSLEYFDVKSYHTLRSKIKSSDIVMMGGGPIMDDIPQLNIILKSFKIAKKHYKKTMIFGCGLGPLTKTNYINITNKLIDFSDVIIFRDRLSCLTANKLFGNSYQYLFSNDPAILSVGNYIKNNGAQTKSNNIAVNFRDFPLNTYGEYCSLSFNVSKSIVKYLSKEYDKVLLVPMHTFSIGGDDRNYLTKISYNLEVKNVTVLHKPLNIYQLYEVFLNVNACIGMRYHSVVLQTLLNKNNFILDYTNKNNGKIISFLDMIDPKEFYKNRYINLQVPSKFNDLTYLDILKDNKKFNYDENIFEETSDFFVSKFL